MPLAWTLDAQAPEDELKVIAEGVFSHGRAQARDGNAEPVACLVPDGPRVVAGGTGRTEYRRLFVSHLWVTEDVRGAKWLAVFNVSSETEQAKSSTLTLRRLERNPSWDPLAVSSPSPFREPPMHPSLSLAEANQQSRPYGSGR